jgi:hypothetical protein
LVPNSTTAQNWFKLYAIKVLVLNTQMFNWDINHNGYPPFYSLKVEERACDEIFASRSAKSMNFYINLFSTQAHRTSKIKYYLTVVSTKSF